MCVYTSPLLHIPYNLVTFFFQLCSRCMALYDDPFINNEVLFNCFIMFNNKTVQHMLHVGRSVLTQECQALAEKEGGYPPLSSLSSSLYVEREIRIFIW